MNLAAISRLDVDNSGYIYIYVYNYSGVQQVPTSSNAAGLIIVAGVPADGQCCRLMDSGQVHGKGVNGYR